MLTTREPDLAAWSNNVSTSNLQQNAQAFFEFVTYWARLGPNVINQPNKRVTFVCPPYVEVPGKKVSPSILHLDRAYLSMCESLAHKTDVVFRLQ